MCCEFGLQLPFFFFAVGALIRKSESLKLPGLIYGSHTATTMAPILAHFAFSEEIKYEEKIVLMCFYLPVSVDPEPLIPPPPLPSSHHPNSPSALRFPLQYLIFPLLTVFTTLTNSPLFNDDDDYPKIQRQHAKALKLY